MWHERLLKLYNTHGLTMQQIATGIGVNKSTVSRMLAGKRRPGADIYDAINAFYDKKVKVINKARKQA